MAWMMHLKKRQQGHSMERRFAGITVLSSHAARAAAE